MISKTHYAMFAFLAVTALSLGVTPAFAFSSYDTVKHYNVVSGYSQTSGTIYDDPCGDGSEIKTDYLKTGVNVPGGDVVKVKYTTSGCTINSISITIYVDGVEKASTTKTSASSTHTFGGIALDVGDDVKAVVYYNVS